MQKRTSALRQQSSADRAGEKKEPFLESVGGTVVAPSPTRKIHDGAEPGSYLHRLWRAALQPTSLLTLEEVIEALPCPEPESRAWLLTHVSPTGELAGVSVYEWGQVLKALQVKRAATVPMSTSTANLEAPPVTWLSTAEAAERLGIARCTLDEMVAQAPRTLPGAPTPIGSGHHRRHWRWDARKLEEWLTAFQAWSASRSQEPELHTPPVRPLRGSRRLRKPPSAPTVRRRSLLSEVAGDQPGSKRSVA